MNREAHQKLYDQIPSFECRPRCTDCCGPVPVTPWEAKQLGISGPLTPVKPGTITCTFVTPSGCSVYPRRPFMCRIFGSGKSPRLQCSHGCGPMLQIDDDPLTERYMDWFDLPT